jgi:hypothetical protein
MKNVWVKRIGIGVAVIAGVLLLALGGAYAASASRESRTFEVSGPSFVLFPATVVDHDAVDDPDPAPGRTVEYGSYLARLCTGCHGESFAGGPIPGAPPEMGVPLNLTPHETGLAGWTEEQFRTVLREGRTPSGHQIDPAQMPYPTMGRMTDDEIGALFMFLQQVPSLPEGSR